MCVGGFDCSCEGSKCVSVVLIGGWFVSMNLIGVIKIVFLD